MNTPPEKSDRFEPRDHVPERGELAGRVVAITGASSGIGRAVALACARCRATVVLIGRDAGKLDAVHGEIAASGAPEASIALLDLERAVARDYDTLADALLERFGADSIAALDRSMAAADAALRTRFAQPAPDPK